MTLVVFSLIALLVSGIFHEQTHARVALWLGDPTGKLQRRLSWNPIYHIDLWMSIVLPVMLLVMSGGRRWFGGMKPVQVNPLNFRNPTLGMALSAVAGPISNVILMIAGLIVLWGFHKLAPTFVWDDVQHHWTFNGLFLSMFIWTNATLAAFNILPLPGLDGSRVIYHFLPRAGQAFLDMIEPYALMITMLLVFRGFGRVLDPIDDLVFELIAVVMSG